MNCDSLVLWIQEAKRRQDKWHEVFKDREIQQIDKNDMLLIKKNIGYAMFGLPATLPAYENHYTGYNKAQLDDIEKIVANVLNVSEGDNLLISYILIIIKVQDDSPDACQDMVLKIHKNMSHSDCVFIDRHSRVYDTWMNFKNKNMLPKCIYCCPVDGHYGESLNLEYMESPACSLSCVVIDKLDTAASGASLATAGALAAGAFVTLAPAVATTAVAGSVGMSVYSTARAVTSLFDRKTHCQSISVTNQEARQSWLNIGSSVLAGLGGAALSRAQRIVSSGKEVSKASITTLRTLSAANVVVSSMSALDALFYCIHKYDNKSLTSQDVFNLSCEILFFFNAIKSVRATNKLLSVMERVTPNTTVKLTKSMKQRLRKRRACVKKQLQNTRQESDRMFSSNIAMGILSVAAVAFIPGAENVMYTVCQLGHDLRCLNLGTIDLQTFLIKSCGSVRSLYTSFQSELGSAFSEIQNLFCNNRNYITEIEHLLTSASETAKFCLKCVFLWVKLAFEKFMEFIGNLFQGENRDSEGANESSESSLNSSDSMEAHEKVVQKINNLIQQGDVKFNTLEEYVSAFDGASSMIMRCLKDKLLDYNRHCKIFKEMNSEFDIEIYNRKLGINGDPEDHFLNELINNYLNKSMLDNLKQTFSQKRSLCKNFEFTLNVEGEKNFYCYIDDKEKGHLPSITEKLYAVNQVTKKPISSESVKVNELEDVVIFLPKEDETWFRGIFMHCSLTEDNAVIYLIMVI